MDRGNPNNNFFGRPLNRRFEFQLEQGIEKKYIEDRTCKFCGDVCLDVEPHLHQGKWVCEDCWDERLRSTE